MSFEQIVAHYGFPALLLGAGLEGETVVLIGGIMAHRGVLSFWPAFLAAAAGSFLADQFFFFLGRRFRDRRLVQKVQTKPAFARAIAAFERHPTLFVFAFRFLYGLRTVSPIAIGTTRLPIRTFVVINAASAAVWALAFVSLGYWFGAGVEQMFGRMRPPALLLAIFAIGGTVTILAIFLRRRREILFRREQP